LFKHYGSGDINVELRKERRKEGRKRELFLEEYLQI
jgi:hypothetical protein